MDDAAFFLALSQRTLYLLYAVASKGKKILLTEVQIIQEKKRALLEKNFHIFSRKNVLEVLRKIWELDKDCVILSKEAVCNF